MATRQEELKKLRATVQGHSFGGSSQAYVDGGMAFAKFVLGLIDEMEMATDEQADIIPVAGRRLLCIFEEVLEERRRQDAKWGGPDHDDEHNVFDW